MSAAAKPISLTLHVSNSPLALRPSQLQEAIQVSFRLNLPLFIEGPPGIGKTAIPKQVAAEAGMAVLHLHTPTIRAEDFGIPWPRAVEADSGSPTFRFLIPSQLPIKGSQQPASGLLLLDELPQATPEVQKVFANIIQEREVYGQKLLPGWRIVATGNRVEDRAGAGRILSHLRDRLTRIELVVSHTDWDVWARGSSEANPARPRVHPEIRAYLLARGGDPYLFNFEPNREVNVTPRAWSEKVSPLLWNPPSLTVLRAMIAGDIGAGPMIEFMSYRSLFGVLPSKEEFFADPEGVIGRLPKDMQVETMVEGERKTFARLDVLYALACMATASLDAENFRPALRAAEALPEDFGAMVFLTFIRQHKTIFSSLPATDVARIMSRWKHLIFQSQPA